MSLLGLFGNPLSGVTHGLQKGLEYEVEAAKMFRDAFPDYHMTIEDIVGEEDRVVARYRQTGTHQGELFGIPPTGKEVDFEEIALLKFADGMIIVSWFQTDLLKMMSQLGIGGEAPAPAPA